MVDWCSIPWWMQPRIKRINVVLHVLHTGGPPSLHLYMVDAFAAQQWALSWPVQRDGWESVAAYGEDTGTTTSSYMFLRILYLLILEVQTGSCAASSGCQARVGWYEVTETWKWELTNHSPSIGHASESPHLTRPQPESLPNEILLNGRVSKCRPCHDDHSGFPLQVTCWMCLRLCNAPAPSSSQKCKPTPCNYCCCLCYPRSASATTICLAGTDGWCLVWQLLLHSRLR